MCGILYVNKATKENVKKRLEHQKDRGLHSIGYVQSSKVKKAVRSKIGEYSEDINKMTNGESVLFHHRKASVGSINIENAHPYTFDFEGGKLNFMQNGTTPTFSSLADIYSVFEGYDDWSDSKVLGYFLSKNAKSLKDITYFLSYWNTKLITFGIILAEHKGNILMYSDGARECYIDEKDGIVNTISNYSKDKKMEYKVKGWVLFNQKSGSIIEKDYKMTQKRKVEKSSYYGSSYNNYDYYGWEEPKAVSNKQESLKELDNVVQDNIPKRNRLLIQITEDLYKENEVKYTTLIDCMEGIDIVSKYEYKQVKSILKTTTLPYVALVKIQQLYDSEEEFNEIFENNINMKMFEKFIEDDETFQMTDMLDLIEITMINYEGILKGLKSSKTLSDFGAIIEKYKK